MEKGGNSAPSHCDVVSARGHNGHDANPAWDIGVDPNTACRFDDWNGGAAYAAATRLDATVAHARSFCSHAQPQHLSVCAAGEGNAHLRADPHLTCLQLGKRRYFEDAAAPATDRYVGGEGSSGGCRYSYSHRRGRSNLGGGATAVPRCQVEGCHVALGNAKDYHKRHRVCDVHSKAPRVVVLGLEQRFCQQCSRFHAVSEFDDSKRSCRRRLAGHNERRRRSSHHDSAPKNSSHQGRALSLLSSTIDAWVSPSDLSSRSSAALRELIAEHRASVLATQLIVDRDWQPRHHAAADFSEAPHGPTSSFWPHQQQVLLPQPHSWVDAFQDDSGSAAQVTLELMQAPSSAFRLLSVRGKAKEDDCSETWKSFEGRHV